MYLAVVELPKLTIKPFGSDQLNWLTFWNSFNTAVHEQHELHNLNNIDKIRLIYVVF